MAIFEVCERGEATGILLAVDCIDPDDPEKALQEPKQTVHTDSQILVMGQGLLDLASDPKN
jgi:hypothetical protein